MGRIAARSAFAGSSFSGVFEMSKVKIANLDDGSKGASPDTSFDFSANADAGTPHVNAATGNESAA
jgi:hypothetical protein